MNGNGFKLIFFFLICFLLFSFLCLPEVASDKVFIRKRLERLEKKLPHFRYRLDILRENGIDVAYPLVSQTVLEQFCGFVEEDISDGFLTRAEKQLDELGQILHHCDNELSFLESGWLNPPVPRYITSPIRIEDGGFRARVRWHDGGETGNWPVIFSGYGAFDSVKRDVELMPDYGMNIIQVELGPNMVLVSESSTDMSEINNFLSLLDRAEAAHVSVNLLLSPHYFPMWAFEKWPEIYIAAGEYIPFSVDSPYSRQVLEDFLRLLIPQIAKHPALHSICLTNEPSYFDASSDPENRNAYNSWLQQRYSTVAGVSDAHGRNYISFNQVPVFYWEEGTVYPLDETDLPPRFDYFRFNDERFAQFHSWMADIIHEYDSGLPVHAKIPDYIPVLAYDGIEPGLFMDFSQISGNDSGKLFTQNSEDSVYANDWLQQNLFFDLLRSISGKPVFNSENHIIRDEEKEEVPPEHIRNVIWQAAIHGECASTMWVWERKLGTEDSGEPWPEFTGIMHSPILVREHGRVALDLLRLGREIDALRITPARVAILYSPTSLLYNADYELYFTVTYEALNFSGEKIDFITEAQLALGEGCQYQMIFIPGVSHLVSDSYDGLESFTAGGGCLLLVGDDNFKYDHLNREVNKTFPNQIKVPFQFSEELREDLFPVLDTLPGGRAVKVSALDSGEEPWGVEWLSGEYNGRPLINLVNYNKYNVKIRLQGFPFDNRIDLITMETVGETIEMRPLETLLITTEE